MIREKKDDIEDDIKMILKILILIIKEKKKTDFNKHGININGLDKDGYNINDVDKDGLDKDGFNINSIKGTRKKIP